MITEAGKFVIIEQMQSGNNNWTSISREVENQTGQSVHRSTIQRWYASEGRFLEDSLLAKKPLSTIAAARKAKEAIKVHKETLHIEVDVTGEVNKMMEERVALDKKLAKSTAETKLYKSLYTKALSMSASEDMVVEAIQNATAGLPKGKTFKAPRVTAKHKGEHSQTMVTPLADTHVGDRVTPEEMNGLNEYNIEIFGERLYGWVGQILDLVALRRNFVQVPHLKVPMLGDMISGDIHEELARTNIDNCMQQMIRGAYMISQALIDLAQNFETIEVPCVVGNHGRMTKRVPSKDRTMDWDYMLYQWVAAFCKDQKNITFKISKAPYTVFDAAGHNILIMHGDSVPGGGASASMIGAVHRLRTVLQYKETAAVEELPADLVNSRFEAVMMGHFHRVDEVDIGTGQIFVVGTMKGGDEYAANRLHLMTEPKQIATYFHPTYGYIGKEIIYLGKYDHSGNTYDDVKEGVWIDG